MRISWRLLVRIRLQCLGFLIGQYARRRFDGRRETGKDLGVDALGIVVDGEGLALGQEVNVETPLADVCGRCWVRTSDLLLVSSASTITLRTGMSVIQPFAAFLPAPNTCCVRCVPNRTVPVAVRLCVHPSSSNSTVYHYPSARSVVAEHCTGLRILHKKAIPPSLACLRIAGCCIWVRVKPCQHTVD